MLLNFEYKPRAWAESQAFFSGFIDGEKRLIYGTTFLSGVFHTCYLHLKKKESNKTKKQCYCSKIPICYLTANKKYDVIHNSGSLASLRLKNIWGGALISVDLWKIKVLPISYLHFYNRLIIGVGLYTKPLLC